MGFLDIFIERTEDQSQPSAKSSIPAIGSNLPPIQTRVENITLSQPSLNAEDVEKFNAHFEDLFQQANLPGPDYFEFSKMCQAMSMLPDETKFPAAYGGLQVQGLSKDKLLETANHYIAIIDEDAKKFSGAINDKIMSDVSNKRAEIEKKKVEIAQKADMISRLQQEIQSQSIEIATMETDANSQEQKAAQKLSTYKTACELRKTMITSDVQKIKTLIK